MANPTKRTRPYSRSELLAIEAEKKASQILTCGTIPSYTQAELDAWVPNCPSLVYNKDTDTINIWDITNQEWVEVTGAGGGDFIMVGSPTGVTTGGTAELLIEEDAIKIDPTAANLSWIVTMNWTAAVSNITGTATGVTVGDTIGGKLIFGYKKISGTAEDTGTISDTRTGASSLVDNNAYLYYQIGASDELEIIFNGPTFTGGGSLDFVIKAEIDVVEVTW